MLFMLSGLLFGADRRRMTEQPYSVGGARRTVAPVLVRRGKGGRGGIGICLGRAHSEGAAGV